MSKKNDLEHTSTTLGSQNMKSSQRMVSVVEPYELPEGWTWCRLGDFINIFRGVSYKKNDAHNEKQENDCLIIRGGNIDEGCINLNSDNVFVNKSLVSENQIIKKNDVIIVTSTGSIKVIGRAGVSASDYEDVAFGAFLTLARPNEKANKSFVNQYFQSSLYRERIRQLASGVNINNIRIEYITESPFPLPPTFAEQQRIVNRIESMFAKLDEAKEKAQNVVDGFETRKVAILHKAFTGELTTKWRKENGIEKNKELDFIYNFAQTLSKKDMTNITDFQKQAYDYVLSDGAVWKKCCIGAIGVITNGSTPSRKEASFWNGNIPWVSSGEVANNIIESTNEMISEEGFNNSSVKKLPIGTVLIAMIGEGKTRGQTSVLNIEATTNQNIAAIIINHGHVESKFLWYWLQKEYKNNRTAGNGSGPQALNCQKVRELPFILPTLPEQVEIVRILDIIIEKENKAKQAAEAVLEQIDLLKKSILARAFRGEL